MINTNSITTAKLQYIKDNIYIPEVGDHTDAHDNKSQYRVVDVWDDNHYRNPHFCLIIHVDHYDSFVAFINSLPDGQQFTDSQTYPYQRCDDVIGEPYTTGIYYFDPTTGQSTLVGYDDYPVICLDANKDCYFDGCESWNDEDSIIETDVHKVTTNSFGDLLVESKFIPDQTYGLETESVAFRLYKEKHPEISEPDVLSVNPNDKINYFDMPQNDIQWLS